MTDFFVHPQAICESTQIGHKTQVLAFAHVMAGAKLGASCSIWDHVFIENDVTIGDRVTLRCGVQLWDGTDIEDDVFIGPNVTFATEGGGKTGSKVARTLLRKGVSVGANATILAGVSIGQNAIVAPGAVVTKDVPANAIIHGSPAQITGYVSAEVQGSARPPADEKSAGPEKSHVTRVSLHHFPKHQDLRGSLLALEMGKDLPFVPKRTFVVFDVPTEQVRGEHAHRACEQFLICLKGSVHVLADDGKRRQEFVLDSPYEGIYLPPMTWGTQYQYSHDATLLVFASHGYDAADYIRSYDEFMKLVGQ